MVCPSWVKSLAQPIAVDDVISYLVESLSNEKTSGKIYEIGGSEKMTYEELNASIFCIFEQKFVCITNPISDYSSIFLLG